MTNPSLTAALTPPPAHVSPAPVAGWEALADRLSDREEATTRGAWQQLQDCHAAHLAWTAAGSPGGSFYSALNARQEHLGRRAFSKTRVYSWLRGGEALARGIQCSTVEEAVAAGYQLQKQLEGGTVPQAVAAVQAEVDSGKLKRKAAPTAPQGCTFRAVPLETVDALDTLGERVARLAERRGMDVPGGSPERLATVISAVSALEDEALEALLDAREHMLIRADAFEELSRVYKLAKEAGLLGRPDSELEDEA